MSWDKSCTQRKANIEGYWLTKKKVEINAFRCFRAVAHKKWSLFPLFKVVTTWLFPHLLHLYRRCHFSWEAFPEQTFLKFQSPNSTPTFSIILFWFFFYSFTAYKYYWLSSAQTLEWIPWSEKILSVFFSAVSTLAPIIVSGTQNSKKKKTHVNELITESVNQSLLKEKNKLELNGSLKNSFKDSMIQ